MNAETTTFRDRVEAKLTRERDLDGLAMETRGEMERLFWAHVDAMGTATRETAQGIDEKFQVSLRGAKLPSDDKSLLSAAWSKAYLLKAQEVNGQVQ